MLTGKTVAKIWQYTGTNRSVADPEFLVRGFFAKRGSNWSINPTLFKIHHENEIIWTKRGVRVPLPWTPSGSATAAYLFYA